ncbi:MAG: hypothetical protein ACRC1F_02615 [Metamycoplasmataceae bacterium]
MKKKLLGLGLIPLAVVPIATMISCTPESDSGTTIKELKEKIEQLESRITYYEEQMDIWSKDTKETIDNLNAEITKLSSYVKQLETELKVINDKHLAEIDVMIEGFKVEIDKIEKQHGEVIRFMESTENYYKNVGDLQWPDGTPSYLIDRDGFLQRVNNQYTSFLGKQNVDHDLFIDLKEETSDEVFHGKWKVVTYSFSVFYREKPANSLEAIRSTEAGEFAYEIHLRGRHGTPEEREILIRSWFNPFKISYRIEI